MKRDSDYDYDKIYKQKLAVMMKRKAFRIDSVCKSYAEDRDKIRIANTMYNPEIANFVASTL
jgi:predicted HAD superfamily hydrolase